MLKIESTLGDLKALERLIDMQARQLAIHIAERAWFVSQFEAYNWELDCT